MCIFYGWRVINSIIRLHDWKPSRRFTNIHSRFYWFVCRKTNEQHRIHKSWLFCCIPFWDCLWIPAFGSVSFRSVFNSIDTTKPRRVASTSTTWTFLHHAGLGTLFNDRYLSFLIFDFHRNRIVCTITAIDETIVPIIRIFPYLICWATHLKIQPHQLSLLGFHKVCKIRRYTKQYQLFHGLFCFLFSFFSKQTGKELNRWDMLRFKDVIHPERG